MRGFRLCPQAIERHWSLHATIAYCVARADSERWGLQRRIMKIIFTTKQIPRYHSYPGETGKLLSGGITGRHLRTGTVCSAWRSLQSVS